MADEQEETGDRGVGKGEDQPGPSRISVVIVGPKFEGNVGAVARAMMNFDIEDLVLVDPCPIAEEAYQRAMHATDILERARRFKTLDEALEGFDYLIGTTGESTKKDKKHLRKTVAPPDMVEHLEKVEGKVAILFGREDYGLYNTELERCDLLVTVPTSEAYPILNLSHAVAVILYEIYSSKALVWRPPPSSDFERGKLTELFENYMDTIEYTDHKRKKARLMMKRIVGRADISKWEFHSLMGVFHMAIKRINRLEKGKKEE